LKQELKIDSIDLEILSELISNARVSYRSLANKLGVSVSTIHNRVEKLIKLGIIKGFTAIVDYSKLGYDVTAVILAKVDGKHLIEVEREIAKHPNVCSVYDITGEFDVAIIAKFHNISELNKFIKSILLHPHIQRTNTSIVFNVVKEDFRLKIP